MIAALARVLAQRSPRERLLLALLLLVALPVAFAALVMLPRRTAIDTDASETALRDAAGPRPSLLAAALARVASGETSLAEVRRVLGDSA